MYLRQPLRVPYRISQGFGENVEYYAQFGYSKGHPGLDLAPPVGTPHEFFYRTPVYAMHEGSARCGISAGEGRYVVIYGTDGESKSAHLDEITVRSGQPIEAGDLIGYVGHSGNCIPQGMLGTHIHLGWRPYPIAYANGTGGYVDPSLYLTQGEDKVAKSKIGAHHNAVTRWEEMLEFYRIGRPRIATMIEHHNAKAFVEAAKQVSPSTLWVGRYWVPDHEQILADPNGAAIKMFNRLTSASIFDLMDVWVGYNEIAGYPYVPNPGSENIINYLRFDIKMAELLASRGKAYGAGSWSVANPDMQWFAHPLMRTLLQTGCYLVLHEYCAPTLWDPRAFDSPYTNREAYLGNGNYCLRYRKVLMVLKANGMPIPRIIIKECGIDTGAPNGWDAGTPYQVGWRFYSQDPSVYLEQLKWYDRQLQMDPEIVGATIFCYGTEDPRWDTFDIRGQAAYMLAQYIGQEDAGIQAIIDRMWLACGGHELPYNPDAAFAKLALARGWFMKSPEVDIVDGYRGQIWMDTSSAPWKKYLIATKLGDWDPSHFIIEERDN